MNKIFSMICLLVFCASSIFADNNPVEIDPPTILDVIIANEDCTTLVEMLNSADLLELLSSEGPYTVFAPINSAFEQLPEGIVTSLLQPESKETLIILLKYHVVEGAFSTADLLEGINVNNGSLDITTLQGGKLVVTFENGSVVLTDLGGISSTLVLTDLEATNGIVHGIDFIVKPEKQ